MKWLVLTIILIVLGFIYRKSKILFAVQMIWMWILTGFNTMGIDFKTNESIYNYSTNKITFGDGFANVLSFIMKQHDVTFITYNVITTFVAYLILYIIIRKKTSCGAMVASFMMLYPFPDFVIQKRFFLAMVIVFVAIQYSDFRKKKNIILYIILVIIAFQFHSSTLFYILPLLFFLIPDKYKTKILVLLSAIAVIMVKYIPNIVKKIGMFSSGKIELYFNELAKESSLYKFAFWIIFQLICISFVWYAKKKNIFKESETINLKFEKTYNMNIELLCLLPLYAFDPVFTRLYRPVLIDNFILCSLCLKDSSVQKIKNIKLFLLQLCISILCFVIFYIITGSGFQYMIMPMFENNLILGA